MGTRRQLSREFKVEAVKLVTECKRPAIPPWLGIGVGCR